MSKNARVWVAVLCIGASAISGITMAQVVPGKVAVRQPVGVGVRDGETQVLAGLLKDEQNNSSAGIPGLAAVPGVGRLFSNQTNTNGRSEIVLLITPRIVRAMPTPPAHVVEFSSGTADNASVRPMRLTPGGQYSGSDPPAALALPQQIEEQR